MADTFADLDILDPAGTDLASTADDQLRLIKRTIENTFHGTGNDGTGTAGSPEHWGRGQHRFPYGNDASRPAYGNAGRIYFNTQQTRIELDTGSSWNLIHAITKGYDSAAGPTLITINPSWVDLADVTVNVSTGSHVMVLAWAEYRSTSTATITSYFRIWNDTESAIEDVASVEASSDLSKQVISMFIVDTTPTLGNVTWKLQATCDSGTAEYVWARALVAFCL